MTEPRFAPCRCAHEKFMHEHEGFAPQCIATGCSCLSYRPNMAASPVPPRAATVPAVPIRSTPTVTVAAGSIPVASAVDQTDPAKLTRHGLIAEGKKSPVKRIASLATKIDTQLNELRALMLADTTNSAARQLVADLERQLAEAKAALRGPATTPAQKTKTKTYGPRPGDHACPKDDCDRTFDSEQGLAMHDRRAHEGWGNNGPADTEAAS